MFFDGATSGVIEMLAAMIFLKQIKNTTLSCDTFGATSGDRTPDLCFTKALLYGEDEPRSGEYFKMAPNGATIRRKPQNPAEGGAAYQLSK